MKLYIFFLIITVSMMSAVTGFSKDTGTYEIEKYNVKLNPLEDGSTRIKYYQKWKVLSGNIPWITIGLANSKFSIIPDSININATSARNASSKNWSGVRIKLDRKYLAGDTFEVTLSVIQHGLLRMHKRRRTQHMRRRRLPHREVCDLQILWRLACLRSHICGIFPSVLRIVQLQAQ